MQKGVDAGSAEKVEKLRKLVSVLGGGFERGEGREEREGCGVIGKEGGGQRWGGIAATMTYRNGLNDSAALVVTSVVHCVIYDQER